MSNNAKSQCQATDHPTRQCNEAGIKPGDEYCSFVADGRITIMRQARGRAWGCLGHLRSNFITGGAVMTG